MYNCLGKLRFVDWLLARGSDIAAPMFLPSANYPLKYPQNTSTSIHPREQPISVFETYLRTKQVTMFGLGH